MAQEWNSSLELFVDILHLFVSSLALTLSAESFGSNTKRLNYITFGIFLNILQNNKKRELDETTLIIIVESGNRLVVILTPFVSV